MPIQSRQTNFFPCCKTGITILIKHLEDGNKIMRRVRLYKNNFLNQVVRFGYFADQFPACFSTEQLAANLSELLPLISVSKSAKSNSKQKVTSPTTLSIYKNDISRRVLSVPNPEAFLRLAKYINENWDRVRKFSKSKETLLFIQLIRDLNLEVQGTNLINIIKSDNDFAIIIALDLWRYRNQKIKRTRKEAQNINEAIRELAQELKGEKLSGARWLLLYEIKVNKLLDDKIMPEIEMNSFRNYFLLTYLSIKVFAGNDLSKQPENPKAAYLLMLFA